MSGFQHAPGSPERRAADQRFLESAGRAPVKNPRRYNTARAAFGVARLLEDGAVVVEGREVEGRLAYASVEALLDAGWTVD